MSPPSPFGIRRFPSPADVVEQALEHSHSDGCIVIVEESTEVETRFANNTTTTDGARRQRRVVVASVRRTSAGMAVGVASRSGDPDIEDIVRASETDAAGAPPAEDAASLVGPDTMVADGSFGELAPAFEEPARSTDFSVIGGVVGALGEAFADARLLRHVLAGFASHRLETVYLGTSAGLRRRHEQPTGALHLAARSTDGTRSSWTAAGTPWFEEVDLPSMHSDLRERLEWSKRRIELPAGRYETILPPDATADLMVSLLEAMSGRDAEDGRNAFSAPGGGTKVGQTVSSLPLELTSDPRAPGLECSPFVVTAVSGTDGSVFDNGLPLGRTAWIEQGVVRRLRYHRAGAARSRCPAAPPIDNVVLELPSAERTLDDLVAGTDRALLVTCLWYIREVDPVTLLLTGLTRDGVYLVERGEVVGVVNNFRFNESPLGVLGRVADVGRSERALSREWGEWMNRSSMPALRVADFNMSSVSAAT
jgi:predicted Zn-dependent protease